MADPTQTESQKIDPTRDPSLPLMQLVSNIYGMTSVSHTFCVNPSQPQQHICTDIKLTDKDFQAKTHIQSQNYLEGN